MKIAIVGSRSIELEKLEQYIPKNVTEIITGGAKGVDTSAKEFALEKGITYKEFLPEYDKYGRAAPIRRNFEIADYADKVIAFWDCKSKGTKSVIDYCRKNGIELELFMFIEKKHL